MSLLKLLVATLHQGRTLVAGSGFIGGGEIVVGYFQSICGSLSPTSFNGATIRNISDHYDEFGTPLGVNFSMTGFGSDPGQSFWTSVTINGVTLLSANADIYNYSAGLAQWGFVTQFGMADGVTYPVTLV